MIRFKHHPVAIISVIIALLGFPNSGATKLRSMTLAGVVPVWSGVNSISTSISAKLFAFRFVGDHKLAQGSEIAKLEHENNVLLRQLSNVREWLLAEERLDREIEQLSLVNAKAENDPFFERRRLSLLHRIDGELHSIPAQIIFREPATWSQIVWIDVGDEDNGNLALPVVQKNSPVLVGGNLFGIIERVEKRRSLVRLITDPTLNVAVRVVRGREKDRLLVESIEQLINVLSHEPRFAKKVHELEIFKDQIEISPKDVYLAKGVLHGSNRGFGRMHTYTLVGEGFNYDYQDAEGPARDLRSGMPYSQHDKKQQVSLVAKGDLLETSGLDALFPEGLKVALVDHIEPLNEGAVAYDIQAKPVVSSLDQIKHVLVIPPIRGIQ